MTNLLVASPSDQQFEHFHLSLGQSLKKKTDRRRHVTFLEEVHNLFSRSQTGKPSSNSLENVFREQRIPSF